MENFQYFVCYGCKKGITSLNFRTIFEFLFTLFLFKEFCMTESINTIQEQFNSESTSSLTLGQQLKAAREALSLSVADVALKTNLKNTHIEAIENDIFILPNVAPAFMRGYVRNYVRFLRLPEALISSVNYGEVTLPKEMIKLTPTKTPSKFQGRILKYLTALILLGALGMTLLWWYQGYQKDQSNRDQFVATAPVASEENDVATTQSPSTTQQSEQEQTTEQPAVEQAQQPQVAQVQAETGTSTRRIEGVQLGYVEQTQPETAISSVMELPPAQPVTTEAINILQQQAAAVATAAESVIGNTAAAMGNDELRIEITGGQSWITVRGAKNKRLAEKLYNSGETLVFNDNEQYRLTIGAPANVKLYYKGQEVPLKIDGRVARIRLPQQ